MCSLVRCPLCRANIRAPNARARRRRLLAGSGVTPSRPAISPIVRSSRSRSSRTSRWDGESDSIALTKSMRNSSGGTSASGLVIPTVRWCAGRDPQITDLQDARADPDEARMVGPRRLRVRAQRRRQPFHADRAARMPAPPSLTESGGSHTFVIPRRRRRWRTRNDPDWRQALEPQCGMQ